MPDNKKATRKLRAILSADVKGYSLLMADDEKVGPEYHIAKYKPQHVDFLIYNKFIKKHLL